MGVLELESSLCKRVWGEEYASNPEYQELMEKIRKGANITLIKSDLKERADAKPRIAPGRLPKPYATNWYSQ